MSPSRSGSDLPGWTSLTFPITESSAAGEARRQASALARRLGLDDITCGRIALAVTEAATNLVKHASGGEIVLRPLEDDPVAGVEVLALDRGPGMADLGRCLRDGFSTAGTLGAGLGAIARQAQLFEVHSHPGVGTALLARLWSTLPPLGILETGAVHLPKPGEPVCGDAWAVEELPGSSLVLVADGLGHGPLAAEASRAAVCGLRDRVRAGGPAELLRLLHGVLRPTRGAAVAVAEIRHAEREVCFAGVGNIAGTICTGGVTRSMVSHNGTLGHEARKFQEFVYPFPSGALLVMHSDGLATQWRLDRYPGLESGHPGLTAAVLYRDFTRGRDDVTVVAVRERDTA